MPQRPFGLVTFLFTDIEGSTCRWESDPETMRVALAALSYQQAGEQACDFIANARTELARGA